MSETAVEAVVTPLPPKALADNRFLRELQRAFTPNASVSPLVSKVLVLGWVLAFLSMWLMQPVPIFPKPFEVLAAFKPLWFTYGIGQELIKSFMLNLEALAWTTVISLILAYLTVLPAVRPLTAIVSKLRFASLVGLTMIFMVMTSNGHELKLWMLVFGETVFFVTTMARNVYEIPEEKFDHARTLRMSEWHVVWEVVIKGHRHQAIETLRQIAAIGWVMLTMVEGVVRSEGGIGLTLLNMDRQLQLESVYAIQCLILGIGLFFDFGLGFINRQAAQYATLKLGRR